jgi:mRNA interferase HicA
VKRRAFIAHLEAHGCRFVREGAKHAWYVGPDNRSHSAVPRHREIVDFLVRKICRELGVALPGKS